MDDGKSGAKKEPQSQKNARAVPKNFLNNSRALPNKTRVLRQIAPESSPESSAKSLSQKFFGGGPFLSLRKGVNLRPLNEGSMGCQGNSLYGTSLGGRFVFSVCFFRSCFGVAKDQERETSPKRKFLGRTSRGHPWVIHADILAQNFGQGGQNPGKKTSTLARTSMTRRRGRPRP